MDFQQAFITSISLALLAGFTPPTGDAFALWKL